MRKRKILQVWSYGNADGDEVYLVTYLDSQGGEYEIKGTQRQLANRISPQFAAAVAKKEA